LALCSGAPFNFGALSLHFARAQFAVPQEPQLEADMNLKTSALALLLILPTGAAPAKPSDPSHHDVRFVAVESDVKLELLDWGGTGRAVVLLAGSGNTAHTFDEFAPRLLDCCHVYAITRRGYGASTRPAGGYGWRRLADDVFEVIEREHIPAPVLIGHSMSGGEMTAVGHVHSNRLAGLVYLDALGDLEDDPPADTEWSRLQQALPAGFPPPPPVCVQEDRRTFDAFRRSLGCSMRFMFPESELRQMFEEESNGSVGPPTAPGWVSRAIGSGQIFRRDYSHIDVPVLALNNGFAPGTTTDAALKAFGFAPKTTEDRAAIDRFMARSAIVFGRWITKLERGVPHPRLVYYPGAGHYVYFTREADVLREIHAFIAALPKS
jgi:pimeloyl-ACP methyl ester carboxylesterase